MYQDLLGRRPLTLNKLAKKQTAKIIRLPNDASLAVRLLEQGIAPDTTLTLAHKAPFNGPLAFHFDGITISMQTDVAEQIKVELV